MISIIIPVLNESKVLPKTLGLLLKQPGDFEIIVADGGSKDQTVEIATAFSRVKLINAPRGRALQMNRGAEGAQGEWLLFLHADTQLPDAGLALLNKLEADTTVQAGGFRHRFSGNRLDLKMISRINNLRCRRTRIFYGDQAPFVRRSLFKQLDGFPASHVLEDVLFMEKVRQVTRPIVLPHYVTTDSRRFMQHGILRSFSRVFLIMSCHKLGLPIPAGKFFDLVR